jgi:hypothetical protein
MTEKKPYNRKEANLAKKKARAETSDKKITHDWHSTWNTTRPGCGYWVIGNCKKCGVHYEHFKIWPISCDENIIKDVLQ